MACTGTVVAVEVWSEKCATSVQEPAASSTTCASLLDSRQQRPAEVGAKAGSLSKKQPFPWSIPGVTPFFPGAAPELRLGLHMSAKSYPEKLLGLCPLASAMRPQPYPSLPMNVPTPAPALRPPQPPCPKCVKCTDRKQLATVCIVTSWTHRNERVAGTRTVET